MSDKAPLPAPGQRLDLFLVSFCTLYFEVLCIRWIPSQLSFLGMFTNFVLVACFLGLGIGCLMTWVEKRLLKAFPVALCSLMGIVLLFRSVRILSHDAEIIFLDGREAHMSLDLHYALAFFFLVVGLAFVPIGHELGVKLKGLPPVEAYSINIGGSLAGLLGFSLLSLLGVPASVWFAVGLVILGLSFRGDLKILALTALSVAVALGLTLPADLGDQIWSPYHRITFSQLKINKVDGNPYPFMPGQNPADMQLFPPNIGFNVLVNGLFYQQPLNLSPEVVAENKILKHLQHTYDTAYSVGSNENVLVVGGGSGNDAAAAMRNGAKTVEVVDIDPSLVQLGRTRHPELPYLDERVKVSIDDARSYFKKNAGKKKFEKIAFGLLDSHIQFSSLSNLRIDSFVYTVESFRDASKLLTDDGIIVVNFTIAHPEFSKKLYAMLKLATGEEPVLYSDIHRTPMGVTVIAGPGARKIYPDAKKLEIGPEVIPSTDDWPFFYLLKKDIGSDYLWALFMILSISALSVFAAGRATRRGVHLHFFALGAAFMLLESKSITTLALLFGSTWMTNSLVFAAVLTAILLANLFVLKFRVPQLGFVYIGLALSIALGYFVETDVLLLATFITFLPIFFAGIIFADSFSKTSDVDYAIGSNILGGVLGASLEYSAMIVGFKSLLILVGIVYLVSYLALLPKGKAA